MTTDDTTELPPGASDTLPSMPAVGRCPSCADDRWAFVLAHGGDILQCPGCSHRVAYGITMPRVVVTPGKTFTRVAVSEDGQEGEQHYDLDHGLVALLVESLVSTLPSPTRRTLMRSLIGV